MGRVIAFSAAIAVALLPLAVHLDWRIAAAGAAAGIVCVAGTQLGSVGATLAGTVLALLVFGAAILFVPASSAVGPAFGMGAALLVVLDAAYFQSRFRDARINSGILPGHLANLALTLVLAALAAVAIILSAAFLASSHPLARPLLATGGGLLAMAAAIWSIAARARSPQPRSWT